VVLDYLTASGLERDTADAAALGVRHKQAVPVGRGGEPGRLRPGGGPAGRAVGVALRAVPAEGGRDARRHAVLPDLVLPRQSDVQVFLLFKKGNLPRRESLSEF